MLKKFKGIFFIYFFSLFFKNYISREVEIENYYLCEENSPCKLEFPFPEEQNILIPQDLKCTKRTKNICFFENKNPEIFQIKIDNKLENIFIIRYRIENIKTQTIKIILNVPEKINNYQYKTKVKNKEKTFLNENQNLKTLILNKIDIFDKLILFIYDNDLLIYTKVLNLKKIIFDHRLLNEVNIKSINKVWIQNSENTEINIEYERELTNLQKIILFKSSDDEIIEIENNPEENYYPIHFINTTNLILTLNERILENKTEGIYEIISVLKSSKDDENYNISSGKKIIISNNKEPTSDLFSIEHPVLILKSGSSHEINFKTNESYKENFTIKCTNENNTGNFISNSGIIEISGVNTKTTKICSIYLDEIFKLKISTIYVFNELSEFISIKGILNEKLCLYYEELNDETIEINKVEGNDDILQEYIKSYIFYVGNEITYNTLNTSFPFIFKKNKGVFTENQTFSLILKDKEEGLSLYEKNEIKTTNFKIPDFGYYYNTSAKINLTELYCELSDIKIYKDSKIECLDGEYDETNHKLQIECSFEINSSELDAEYNIYINERDTNQKVKISRILNDLMKFNASIIRKESMINVKISSVKSSDGTTQFLNIDSQPIHFTFNQSLDFSKFNNFTIKINEIESTSCNDITIKTDNLICYFNFSNIISDIKQNDLIFIINENEYKDNPKIDIITTNESCNILGLKHFTNDSNSEGKCVEKCELPKQYINNNECVEKCEFPKQYINNNECVEKCDVGYGIDVDINDLTPYKCILCSNYKKIEVNSNCINKNEQYSSDNIYPETLLPITEEKLEITFEKELNEDDINSSVLYNNDFSINSSSCVIYERNYRKIICTFKLDNAPPGLYYLKINTKDENDIETGLQVRIEEKVKCDKDSYKVLDITDNKCKLCSEINSSKPFYENENCISECSSDYGISPENENLCINCTIFEFILSDGKCSICPNDTIFKDKECITCVKNDSSTDYLYFKNITNKICVNKCPEQTYQLENMKLCVDNCSEYSSKFKNDDIDKKCVSARLSCNDEFCENNGICYISNENLRCKCVGNFTGLTCNINLNETEIKNKVENDTKIIQMILQDEINDDLLQNSTLVFSVKELGNLLQNSKKLDKKNSTPNSFFESSKDNLKLVNDYVKKSYGNNKYKKDLIHFTGSSIFYHVHKLFKLRGFRKLDDDSSKKDNTRDLNTDVKQFYEEKIQYITNLEFENCLKTDKYCLELDSDGKIQSIILPNIKNNYLEYIQDCKKNNHPFISIVYADLIENSYYNELYLIIFFSPEVLNELDYESPSQKVKISKFAVIRDLDQEIKKVQKISSSNSIVSLPLNLETNSKINLNLFKYFLNQGIDIYNKNDAAFQNRCYRNDKLKIDYPQRYRRGSIYQNYTITGTNPNCIYLEYDKTTNFIEMLCIDLEDVGYFFNNDPFTEKEIKKTKRLPFRCVDNFSDYKNNLGLWIFTAISFLLISFVILSLINSEYDYDDLSAALQNDKIFNEDFIKVPDKSFHGKGEGNPEIANNKTEDNSVKESISKIFCVNFFNLHPAFSLLHISLVQPRIVTLAIFFNNLANLLGWNAFFFTEKMFERRIFKKHRENFSYPMKYEFDRIICAIATTIGITLVIRLITLTSYLEKTNIEQKMRDKTEEEKMHISKEYRHSILIRNLIGIILVICLVGFFFYYCTIFCYIYVNTQRSWLFSGIWALMWNWVVFAPLDILFISAVENSGSEACAHYLKQLFIF